MMSGCLVRREKPGGLSAEEWSFSVIEDQILLGHYSTLTRPSKRHKYQRVGWYDRYNKRDSTLKLDDVPLPDDVAEEVLAEVRARFRVVRELRR